MDAPDHRIILLGGIFPLHSFSQSLGLSRAVRVRWAYMADERSQASALMDFLFFLAYALPVSTSQASSSARAVLHVVRHLDDRDCIYP